MTPAQKKAVLEHRKRQANKGFVRMEVSVPKGDRELLRQIAANLRAGGEIADKTRFAMRSVINPYVGMNFKELLEAAPLEGVDLERSKETWRDIEF